MNGFKPCLMTTGIGSLPFEHGDEGVDFVLESGTTIPFWPQLPKRGFSESMIPQYVEGMPCVRLNEKEKRIVWEVEGKSDSLCAFYDRVLNDRISEFALSEGAAEGFYAFERRCAGGSRPFVKGQITGPVTFSSGILAADRTPMLGDPEMRDAVVNLLSMKARWQVSRLRSLASEGVLMFVDEPVLTAFGSSAYMGLTETDVISMERELLGAVAADNVITGIHICGNTDWGVVIRTGVQVISLDAYNCGLKLALYPNELREFFDRGGCIAWGIVPTGGEIEKETVETLISRFGECILALEEKGFARELLIERSLLTPSCGLGGSSVSAAGKVFSMLSEVQQKLRGRFVNCRRLPA